MAPNADNTAVTGLNDQVKEADPDPTQVTMPIITGEWTVAKVLAALPTGEALPTGADPDAISSPVAYFHMLERLKTTKRSGWKKYGIFRGESVADHMYRMSIISMIVPPGLEGRIDSDKCMRMSLVHDMAESLVGDITPADGIPKPEKSRREAETMEYMMSTLLSSSYGAEAGEEMRALWQEYEANETLESHFVHDVDKIELLLQMVEYEKRGEHELDLGKFAYVATRLELDDTKVWAREILEEREAYWGKKQHDNGAVGPEGGVPNDHLEAQAE